MPPQLPAYQPSVGGRVFATRLLPRLGRGAGAQTGRSPPHAGISCQKKIISW
ncbi:MAG: hypothetical protein U0V04_13390 [Spirosomataceae bacterium]